MLVVMKLTSSKDEIEKVRENIHSQNCITYVIPGSSRIAIGITGDTRKLNPEDFLTMDSVVDAVRVTKNYKLVSRDVKMDDTIINVCGRKIGGNNFTVIAGPCSVESYDQTSEAAEKLVSLGIKFIRAGAYKPRSSPYSFQGLKEKGLEILLEIKKKYDVGIVTEAKDTETLPFVAEVADIIQIGARNMQNFSLLEKVGSSNKPVFLKRGLSATIEDLLMSAEYILAQGNFNVILCERGIRTFETMTRNTLDLNAVPVIKKQSHLPIFVDPSHGIGIRNKVIPMALASAAAGADGIMIEVHPNPDKALSDGFQSLTIDQFKLLMEKLEQLLPVVGKKIDTVEVN